MKWLIWLVAALGLGVATPRVTPVKRVEQPVTISIAVTGDVLLARSVNAKMVELNDFTYPWKNVAEKLRGADVTYINLETPLTTDCRPTMEGMTFCGDVRGVQGLKFAGVDVANLANNHACNYGAAGLSQTKEVLRNAGISWTGTEDGEPVIEVKKKKIGFLGFSDLGAGGCGINGTAKLTEKVKSLKELADLVVVQFHFGLEYRDKPAVRQVNLARQAIDAGADLVVGNHPHWIQTTERYKDKLIVYSHGNFIFDQTWSKKTMEGVVGWYEWENASVSASFLPVNTGYDLQTRWE
ncbi:hypothetical protein A2899_00005 [Candidatus Amesbacteria bacterium RIFCSPLOWO2_01_FULL_49_25]|uniref:Capsule synthesis protein CapA domain-containing protein n=1 Tax=Candidatus Amesbacteria bacterium RIFCSPHIGHO2_01_FULL_48_32b TaxID=1797253 RepID=A0A1F4YGX9_9BACT|nr:MAG: hypothetical protein A2876_04750 [Candidatus Amesbacteria bacterium RIFCSPHIGHO2_01_FULL_48_32b]OGD07004.1 MAG: hypothetical protein A2899_00005 [Candidatus Amesbacteria bacterium RIFCSPLOWO2_01_FULL_49_25]